MERYTSIIGNAWGVGAHTLAPMHYWMYQGDGAWKTACGIEIDPSLVSTWSNVPYIDLFYGDDEEKCQECLEFFLETDYGKKYGVKAPYINKPTEED